MLKQFGTFLYDNSEFYDFQDYRWESPFGEVFLLTKDLREELSRNDEWTLCLRIGTNKGIAVLRNSQTGETSYLFFPDYQEFQEIFLSAA